MKLFFLPFYGVPCCENFSSEDIIRFALGSNRLVKAHSPMQAELMLIIGGITQKQAPHMQNLWSQFVYPAFCIHVAGCDKRVTNYSMVDDASSVIEIDHSISTCELDQEKINEVLLFLRTRKK